MPDAKLPAPEFSAAPPQPEPLQLPDLQDSVLDAETVRRLFFDLSQLATILDIRIKGAALAHARDGTPDLETARRVLHAGDALGVQIRYLHQGTEWIDTLLRGPHGTRLVRMRAPQLVPR